jgi:hypothetical protein
LDYATFGVVFWMGFGFIAVVYLLIATIQSLAPLKQTGAVATFAGIAAVFLLGALRIYLVSRLASLRVDRQGLLRTNELGLRRRVTSDRIARIYAASFYITIKYPYVMSYFLFLDRNGRTVIKLPAKWWPQEGIDAIGAALGVPVNGAIGTLSGPAFRAAFPGSISWVVAHPRLAAYAAGPLFVASLIGVLALVSLLPGPS